MRELPVERRRPTVWALSAELGDPEPTFGKPMGLVLDRLTVPDLERSQHRNWVRFLSRQEKSQHDTKDNTNVM